MFDLQLLQHPLEKIDVPSYILNTDLAALRGQRVFGFEDLFVYILNSICVILITFYSSNYGSYTVMSAMALTMIVLCLFVLLYDFLMGINQSVKLK
ncbi:hypothetical protein OWV82_022053 [Melia azedarach]|uniref:Uncharacterized protein n=1 Tax=Melia azedarach TaxID=155640 RepID=A0ACC1X2V7_MELAZ|nr:hypothetical protein OWV82_022053 [Melia azedarach]